MNAREDQPRFIPPMLLASGPPPSGEAWAFEIKWDGCRTQLRYDGRTISLRTRHGRECSGDFPELAEIASALGTHRVTLDCELVCLRPDGRPDFARLRRRLTGSAANPHPAILQVFDGLSRVSQCRDICFSRFPRVNARSRIVRVRACSRSS